MIDVLSLGWASLMLVLFSLALVVWEETVLISHSNRQKKLN
jgi:hypothetical protein